MSVFDKIRKNLTETGKLATEKAKNAKDIFKVKEQIRSNQKEIRTLTYKIGQTYLDLHGEDGEEAFADLVRGIAEAKSELEEKEKELARLKEQVKNFDLDDDDDHDDDDDDDEVVEKEEAPAAAVEEAAEAVEEAAACCEAPAEEAPCCEAAE